MTKKFMSCTFFHFPRLYILILRKGLCNAAKFKLCIKMFHIITVNKVRIFFFYFVSLIDSSMDLFENNGSTVSISGLYHTKCIWGTKNVFTHR